MSLLFAGEAALDWYRYPARHKRIDCPSLARSWEILVWGPIERELITERRPEWFIFDRGYWCRRCAFPEWSGVKP